MGNWLQRYFFWPCIPVRCNVTVVEVPENQVKLKGCAPFAKCITKIDGTTTDDATDLDLVILMYNLLEYTLNYFDATGSLWFYSKDEAANSNYDIKKSLKYKAKLLRNTVA